MACSKYTLTNTGSTIVNFNYRRCDDSLWEYQVELNPNQTKNIWLINNTYSISPVYVNSVSLFNQGAFPPVGQTATPTPTATQTPTVTPTQTQTPTPSTTATLTPTPTQTSTQTPTNTQTQTQTPTNTETPTQTQTPTNTETPTQTPTNTATQTQTQTPTNTETPTQTPTNTETPTPTQTPTNTGTPTQTPTNTMTGTADVTPTVTPTQTQTPTSPLQVFNIFSGNTSNEACNSGISTTLYAFNPTFDANTQFYNDPSGIVTIDLTGFYSNNSSVTELDSTGGQVGFYNLCSLLPTSTPTATTTQTPTNTPTQTTTPTATFGYYTYSLGTGSTTNEACADFSSAPNTVYGTVAGGVGPNLGEYLYVNTSLTTPVADGYYSNGVDWYQVSGGAGQITTTDPNGCVGLITPTPTSSNTPTPTETPTNTPTVTETPTGTPTQTPTNTETSTPTPTQTPTPTSPLYAFNVFSGSTSNAACTSGAAITLHGFNVLFDANTQFYNNSDGTVTIDLAGFFSDGTSVTQLSSGGAQVGSFTLCSVVPTQTPTVTQTSTPTRTPTQTPTPTATFGYYTYSLGTGSTSSLACTDFGSAPNTIYGTVAGGIGPNVGEFLYANTALTIPVTNGYYSNGTAWYQVTGGAGQITSTDPTGCP